MPSETATAIAYVGAFVGLVGGGVALFNSWMSVRWKRAELANSYLRDFNNNPELVFACRCLDWNAGRLPLPENLRPLANDQKFILHDRRIFAKALDPGLLANEMDHDPRVQIYRVAIDAFLSWLTLVSSALNRNLFSIADIEEVGYWVAKIQSERDIHAFIRGYGYQESMQNLIKRFREEPSAYQRWFIPVNSFVPDRPPNQKKPEISE